MEPPVGALTVRFRQVDGIPDLDEFWVESHELSETRSRFALFRFPGGFGLSIDCQGRGVFRIAGDQIDIEWVRGGTGAAHYFFSYAMPLWLECKGVLVLHASAVALNGVAIAFLGKSGAGKSSLAEALTQLGAELVADDGLPVMERTDGRWSCLSGPPLVKLLPNSIDLLKKGETRQFKKVHQLYEKRILPRARARSLDENALSLASIYILRRNLKPDGEVRITPAGGSAAPIRLIEHSLAGGPASALGLSAKRFQQLARVVRKVPVRILNYPGESKNFPMIMEALTADIQTSKSEFVRGSHRQFTSDRS